jgi:hypothetical protein
MPQIHADVAKLVDAPDLGSGGATRVGSSPTFRTILRPYGFRMARPEEVLRPEEGCIF